MHMKSFWTNEWNCGDFSLGIITNIWFLWMCPVKVQIKTDLKSNTIQSTVYTHTQASTHTRSQYTTISNIRYVHKTHAHSIREINNMDPIPPEWLIIKLCCRNESQRVGVSSLLPPPPSPSPSLPSANAHIVIPVEEVEEQTERSVARVFIEIEKANEHENGNDGEKIQTLKHTLIEAQSKRRVNLKEFICIIFYTSNWWKQQNVSVRVFVSNFCFRNPQSEIVWIERER